VWTATSITNAPTARASHTAVWTGTEMIIWGGTDRSGNPLNTGSRYNPTTDSWTAISTTNAPAARSNHSAVWTGTEMIVWGGDAGSPGIVNRVNTGGRYDPRTDSWTAISTTNAPAGRSFHQAVWTGSEMIVWGGSDAGFNDLTTGGKYNAKTDSWTATSMSNVASGRVFFTAVWSGTEMMVWGGLNSNGYPNIGGRYNPSTDTWTSTNSSGAPSGRAFHTAVWSGSEMIIWGGLNNNGEMNTGGRYKPATDSWTSTDRTTAPPARAHHVAVWTGPEMIVWGSAVSTGAKYSPANDGWVGTCTANAPTARVYETSIWTGSEMIVWGGQNGVSDFTSLNTGGRYLENPIVQPAFFVHQHYLDFLNREPDASGLAFWINELTSCGSNAACIEAKRVNVSAAFFLSIEFQQTGYLVERLYKAGYGYATGTSTLNGAHQLPVPIIRFSEFLPDTQQIGQGVVVGQNGWETVLENNKQNFTAQFVQRSRFATAFPTSMTPAQFVDRLNTDSGNVLSSTDRATAIGLFGGAIDTSNLTARAQALRQVAENQNLNNAEFNRAFVLMQYFGYLRRNPNEAPDPDYTGFDFWLTKLNQFNGNFVAAEMVKAFITSSEYRNRFGP